MRPAGDCSNVLFSHGTEPGRRVFSYESTKYTKHTNADKITIPFPLQCSCCSCRSWTHSPRVTQKPIKSAAQPSDLHRTASRSENAENGCRRALSPRPPRLGMVHENLEFSGLQLLPSFGRAQDLDHPTCFFGKMTQVTRYKHLPRNRCNFKKHGVRLFQRFAPAPAPGDLNCCCRSARR